MSFLGRVFGTKKAISDITDKDNGLLTQVGGWIGGMNYTDEERAEAESDTRKWALQQLTALAPFKIMQRIMVTIIMVEWAILLNCMIVAGCIGAETVSTALMEIAMSKFAWIPVAGCVGLYLYGGVIPSRNK